MGSSRYRQRLEIAIVCGGGEEGGEYGELGGGMFGEGGLLYSLELELSNWEEEWEFRFRHWELWPA